MRKHWKRLIAGGAALVCLAALLVCTLPLRTRVDVTLPALRWSRTDVARAEPCELVLRGRFDRYLLRQDRFLGSISVSGLELPAGSRLALASFDQHFHAAELVLITGEGESVLLGQLFADKGLDEVSLWLSEGAVSGVWNRDIAYSDEFVTSGVTDRAAAYARTLALSGLVF